MRPTIIILDDNDLIERFRGTPLNVIDKTILLDSNIMRKVNLVMFRRNSEIIILKDRFSTHCGEIYYELDKKHLEENNYGNIWKESMNDGSE